MMGGSDRQGSLGGILDRFKWPLVLTVAAVIGGAVWRGPSAPGILLALIALEASISFDNAVVNADVLQRLDRRWQTVFLTVGLAIAVFGMRIFLPIALVSLGTGLGLGDVVDRALHRPNEYAADVRRAAPMMCSFGGSFLSMVALTFFLDEKREVSWIGPIERALKVAGKARSLPTGVAAGALLCVSQIVPDDEERMVLLSGLAAIVSFLVIRGVSDLLRGRRSGKKKVTGLAALGLFSYLEILDASFSLDGVLGAFAISKDVVVIGVGLGVGALYVRSMTIYFVRRNVLGHYRYLKNGANWAVAALAVILYANIEVHTPEWLAASSAIGIVGASLVASIVHGHRSDARGASAAR